MEKQYYISNEEFKALTVAWKKLASEKKVTSADILIYNILRNKPASRGFVPTTNAFHIQGNNPWYAFEQAKWMASWTYLGGRDEEQKEKRKQAFLERFGLIRPDDFSGKVQESGHE